MQTTQRILVEIAKAEATLLVAWMAGCCNYEKLNSNEHGHEGIALSSSASPPKAPSLGKRAELTEPFGTVTFKAISMSEHRDLACGITNEGGVVCWGDNKFGQLGNGTHEKKAEPTPVVGLSSGTTSLSVGRLHACALNSAGAVHCWGYNKDGQLGDGTNESKDVPTPVVGLQSGVRSISAHGDTTCAVTKEGAAVCWGALAIVNVNHEDGYEHKSVPTGITNLESGIVSIAAGPGNCVVTSAGAGKCWGNPELVGKCPKSLAHVDGDEGGTDVCPVAETMVGLESGVSAINGGGGMMCALTSKGSVHCWGLGTIGDGKMGGQENPTQVLGMESGVKAVSVGSNFACALNVSGGVKCWGRYGARSGLIVGSDDDRIVPTQIPGMQSEITSIASGEDKMCAITSTGKLKCLSTEELPLEKDVKAGGLVASDKEYFEPKGDSRKFKAISADRCSSWFACGVTAEGGLECSPPHHCGRGSEGSSPVLSSVSGLSADILSVSVGAGHACALGSGGELACFGFNTHGQLGNGTTEDQFEAIRIAGPGTRVPRIAAVSTSLEHTCAITQTGAVMCWGDNRFGKIGGRGDSRTPRALTDIQAGAVAIATGEHHSCALNSAGRVQCWGLAVALGKGTQQKYESDSYGNITLPMSSSPVLVGDLPWGITAISAGGSHTCALSADGGVICWGVSTSMQFGGFDDEHNYLPMPVAGLGSGVVAISSGTNHDCALMVNGSVKCWSGFYDKFVPTEIVGAGEEVKAISAGGGALCILTSAGVMKCCSHDETGNKPGLSCRPPRG